MLKIIVLILLNSLLFSLSVKEQKIEMRKMNNVFISQGNPTRIFRYDIIQKTKTFDYGFEVEFTKAGNLQAVITDLCSKKITREAIENGWTYKMLYRNKFSKKTVATLSVDKYNCR